MALVNRKAQKSPSFIEKNIAVGAPTIATRTMSDVLFEKPTREFRRRKRGAGVLGSGSGPISTPKEKRIRRIKQAR